MANPISSFFGFIGRLLQSGSERIEDPAYALDRAYSQQLQALEETRKGRLEVETIGARLELDMRQLDEGVGACEDQARRALQAGRDDLARISLARREELREQVARTTGERERLEEERRSLHRQETELAGALQAFRSRKEVLKAQYGATRARLRVGEALTGYSRTVTTVGDDVRRFEERLLMLQARARALETVAIGPAIGSTIAPAYVERELTFVSVSPRIEVEVERLRAELGLPEATTGPALGPGTIVRGAESHTIEARAVEHNGSLLDTTLPTGSPAITAEPGLTARPAHAAEPVLASEPAPSPDPGPTSAPTVAAESTPIRTPARTGGRRTERTRVEARNA